MKNRLILWGGLVLCLTGILSRSALRNVAEQKYRPATGVVLSHAKAAAAGTQPAMQMTPRAVSVADQILALLAAGDTQSQNKVYKELLPDWVRRDPNAVAAFAESPQATPWRVPLMTAVAQTWTDNDVDAAETWAAQLSNPTERSMVLGYVAFEEANVNSDRAVQVLGNQQMSDDRRTIMVQSLAIQWADQDLQPLYNWLNTLPAGEQRDDWFARVALAQARNSPAQAAQMVSDHIAPGPIQNDAALQVLRQWARQDQAAAAAWVDQFPAALHDLAVGVLAGNLAGAYQPAVPTLH